MTTRHLKIPCLRIQVLPLISLAFAALLVGCGSESPERARAELAKLNLRYSPDDFITSIESGDNLAVRHFLTAGMKVDVVNRKNEVPLLVAAYKGHTQIAGMLIDAGATDEAALRRAAANGHLDTVKLLVKRAWDVRRQSSFNGGTALSQAAEGGYADIVEFLSEHGADINQGDLRNGSPLNIAIQSLQPKVAEVLIKAGAKLDAINGNGDDAIAVAKQRLDRAGINGADRATEKMRAEQILKLLNSASGNRQAP